MLTATVALTLHQKMAAALARLKYRVVRQEVLPDPPGMVRLHAEPDPAQRGKGAKVASCTRRELDEAAAFLAACSRPPEPEPLPASEPVQFAACAAPAPASIRIGNLGESRAESIERARSLARPVARAVPSLRPQAQEPAPEWEPAPEPEPAPAPSPEPTPAPARSHSAFRPYPPDAAPATPKRKSPLTAEQRSAIARKAVETRRRNAAMKAAG